MLFVTFALLQKALNMIETNHSVHIIKFCQRMTNSTEAVSPTTMTDHKGQQEPNTIATSPRTKVDPDASTSSQYSRHERSTTMFEQLDNQSSRTTAQSSATSFEFCTTAPSPTMFDTVTSFEHCKTALSHTMLDTRMEHQAHRLNRTDETTPSIDFTAIITTVYIAWNIFKQNMREEPTTWKMEQFCFHTIMTTRYIISDTGKAIHEIVATAMIGLVIPPIASFEGVWYLVIAILSMTSIIYIELTLLVSRFPTESRITLILTPSMVNPTALTTGAPIKALPSSYMILSCFMLSNAYVGWLRKVGARIHCP